jgi:uncharacterized protein involved in tolerance to divalent cations
MTRFITVLTTAASEAEADQIATALVSEKLAACVQFTPVRSRYVWKGELVKDDEVLLIIKSRRDRFEALAARIKALHSYETPEIVMLEIADGAPDYLAWLEAGTDCA